MINESHMLVVDVMDSLLVNMPVELEAYKLF
jgi:hypothetical protein